MKRVFTLLTCLLLLFGCSGAPQHHYRNTAFTAALPERFEPVENAPVLCFAPFGDPLHASSITVSSTELNWYFDDFSDAEYRDALVSLCGYEDLAVREISSCRVDGYDAKRIACSITVDQGTHDLIIYAIGADRIWFFTLLNRQGDSYVDSFDSMMKTVRFSEGK